MSTRFLVGLCLLLGAVSGKSEHVGVPQYYAVSMGNGVSRGDFPFTTKFEAGSKTGIQKTVLRILKSNLSAPGIHFATSVLVSRSFVSRSTLCRADSCPSGLSVHALVPQLHSS